MMMSPTAALTFAATLLQLMVLAAPRAALASGGAGSSEPLPRYAVLLLDLHSETSYAAEALREFDQALARGLGRTGRFELVIPLDDLGRLTPAACHERDCFRGIVQQQAGYLLTLSITAQDKDYSFRLAFTDAADPASRLEIFGNCDICSFDEACQALEDLVARTRLPDPIKRMDPMPPRRVSGAVAEPGPPPTPSGAPAVAPSRSPSMPVPPEPPTEAAARLPSLGPSLARPWPPGWTLWGGSVGHSGRAVGWGMIGAGISAVLWGASALQNPQPGNRASGAAIAIGGVAATLSGAVFLFWGDSPPPGSGGDIPAQGEALGLYVAPEGQGGSLGLQGVF